MLHSPHSSRVPEPENLWPVLKLQKESEGADGPHCYRKTEKTKSEKHDCAFSNYRYYINKNLWSGPVERNRILYIDRN